MTIILPAVAFAAAMAAPLLSGRVTGVLGLTMTVEGVDAAVGDLVDIHSCGQTSARGSCRSVIRSAHLYAVG